MISREEQLIHEIDNRDIDAYDAIEIMIELDTYRFIPDILKNLKLDKKDREMLLLQLDKATSTDFINPFLSILEDKDEWVDFFKIVVDYNDTYLTNAIIVDNIYNDYLWQIVLETMAGQSQEYVKLISYLLMKTIEINGTISETDFMLFYHSTSSRDFANIISDKAFILPNFIMEIVFEIAKDLMNLDNNPTTVTNPPAAGLLLNAIDINMDTFPNKYTFDEPFKMYMYKYTKKEEYLPKGIKDVFIF